MPRKPEPSFSLKQIIWDTAASVGTGNVAAIYREVDHKIRQFHKNDELVGEEIPDERTVRRIIERDIQRLPPEVVVTKLPRHVWCLRNDYEAIKQLAESDNAWQQTRKEQQEDPSSSLTISVREVGVATADPESGKGGQLVAFTLGNCSNNVLTVERICLEVLSYQSYDELPRIEARVIPLKYEVKLSPDRLGEYVVTEESFRYEGPGADDFDLVCDSPAGLKYNVRLNIYFSDLATNKHFTLSSDAFDICFYKKGDALSRYIHKGHTDEVLKAEAHANCTRGDHSWFHDRRFAGVACKFERSHDIEDLGNDKKMYFTVTCHFCGHSANGHMLIF